MASKVPVRFHPLAEQESLAAFRWYEERNALVAKIFIVELEAAMDLIAESPGRWPRIIGGVPATGLGGPDRLGHALRGNGVGDRAASVVADMSWLTYHACRIYGPAVPVNEVAICELTLPGD